MNTILKPLLLSACLLAIASPLPAQEGAAPESAAAPPARPAVSPEARAVLGRMTDYLQGLQAYTIESRSTRDEVLAYGYKLQNNERVVLTVQRPDKLHAEVSGDVRDRRFIYDGSQMTIYSPEDAAYVRIAAPNTLRETLGSLLDAGVEMPLIDVLYQATAGTLAESVRAGTLIGSSDINGVACDHLAFRQASIDWQLWVAQGDRPLPRKILITTRYEVGEPQFQSVLDWTLDPAIDAQTFKFAPPAGATEISFIGALVGNGGN